MSTNEPKMTSARARFLLVDALREHADPTGGQPLVTFYPHGLATDDDVTTWADVFAAAEFDSWANAASNDRDAAEYLQEVSGRE